MIRTPSLSSFGSDDTVGDQINTSMDESFNGKKQTGSISYCHSTK